MTMETLTTMKIEKHLFISYLSFKFKNGNVEQGNNNIARKEFLCSDISPSYRAAFNSRQIGTIINVIPTTMMIKGWA